VLAQKHDQNSTKHSCELERFLVFCTEAKTLAVKVVTTLARDSRPCRTTIVDSSIGPFPGHLTRFTESPNA